MLASIIWVRTNFVPSSSLNGLLFIDHVLSATRYHASDDADTLDILMRGDEEARERMCQVYFTSKSGYHHTSSLR